MGLRARPDWARNGQTVGLPSFAVCLWARESGHRHIERVSTARDDTFERGGGAVLIVGGQQILQQALFAGLFQLLSLGHFAVLQSQFGYDYLVFTRQNACALVAYQLVGAGVVRERGQDLGLVV